MNEEEIHMKWKKILRGISVEDSIRCEGYNEDYKEGILSAKELEEEIYQISIKYSFKINYVYLNYERIRRRK
jgi:hypothetical protein